MGDMQMSGATDAQQKWASGFTGLDVTKAKAPGTPPAAPPAIAPRPSASDDRVAAMDAQWQQAVKTGDWKTAATVVNGFSPDDLQKRLKPLSAEQRATLHQGALDAGIGEDSAAAKASKDLAGLVAGANLFVFELPVPPVSCAYAKLKASAKCSLSWSLVEASDTMVKAKLKDLTPQIQLALSQNLGKGVTFKAEATVEKSKGNVSAGLEFKSCAPLKHTFGFDIVSRDDKGQIHFAELKTDNTLTVAEQPLEVAGVKIKFSGKIVVGMTVGPEWKAIAEYAAKELGITIAEDVAAGAAAGGTGTAGAVAVAVAPVAGILGGIVGGFALAAGICASIGKLKEFGADCMAVCQEGQRELRSYAESYGSAMRGKPGTNKQGNDDAESALQAIMAKTPGMTREQAVEAAIASKQDYENLAFRRLLPVIRAQVEKKYKEKEGTIGWFFSSDTLGQMMKEFLGENDHY